MYQKFPSDIDYALFVDGNTTLPPKPPKDNETSREEDPPKKTGPADLTAYAFGRAVGLEGAPGSHKQYVIPVRFAYTGSPSTRHRMRY